MSSTGSTRGTRAPRSIVTMDAGTKLIREDDGTEVVPPWVQLSGAAVLRRGRHPVRRRTRAASRRRARRGRPDRLGGGARAGAEGGRACAGGRRDGPGAHARPDRLPRPSLLRRLAPTSPARRPSMNVPTAAIKGTVNLRKQLAAGVTTVRDLGGLGTCELARAVEAGVVPGPRVIAARPRAHDHRRSRAQRRRSLARSTAPTSARKAVREEIKGGATRDQGDRDRRRAHAGDRRDLHGLHAGGDSMPRSTKRTPGVGASPPTRSAPKGSSVPSARASTRSSTASR